MKSISQCLNKQLSTICQHSMQLEELSLKISAFLPSHFISKCQVGSFNKGCLALTTTNAAFASEIRYLLPELRDKLRKEAGLYQLSSIKITIIAPSSQIENPAQKKSLTLSEKAKATIISESQHCTYEPLKKALLHLAQSE
ncbi:TPA: DciA family protein [Legionella pneumophila]